MRRKSQRTSVLLRRLCFFPASIAMVEFQTSSSMFGVGQWRSDSVEWGESKNNMRNECLIFSSVRKCSPPFPVPIFFLSPFKLNMLPSYCSKTQLFCNWRPIHLGWPNILPGFLHANEGHWNFYPFTDLYGAVWISPQLVEKFQCRLAVQEIFNLLSLTDW